MTPGPMTRFSAHREGSDGGMRLTMHLCGARTIAELDPSLIRRRAPADPLIAAAGAG